MNWVGKVEGRVGGLGCLQPEMMWYSAPNFETLRNDAWAALEKAARERPRLTLRRAEFYRSEVSIYLFVCLNTPDEKNNSFPIVSSYSFLHILLSKIVRERFPMQVFSIPK